MVGAFQLLKYTYNYHTLTVREESHVYLVI